MGRTLQQYKKLFDDLKKKGPTSAYLLYGPEEYIKKEFIAELINAALGTENRAFNLDILHGNEFDRDTFNTRISSFPLFSDRRMVIIKDIDALSTPDKDFVLDRIEALPESLVFVAESGVDTMGTARLKRLKKVVDSQGVTFRFQHLSDEETVERVHGRLRREGLTIDAEALDLLVASVGTHLADLTNELEKIILSAGDPKVVDKNLVSEVVGRYRTENLFSFIDRVGSHNVGDLVVRMNRVIDGGEEPIFVMAMLIRRVLLLLEVRCLLAERGAKARAPQVMAGLLSGHTSPFYAAKLIQQAQQMDPESLHDYLDNLRWADMKLKSSSIPPRSILETALIASSLRKKLALYAN
jgi:DNA polymerase-3 subunit delta